MEMTPGNRPHSTPVVRPLARLLVLGLVTWAAVAGAAEPVRTFPLFGGVVARVEADGNLVVLTGPGQEPLLDVQAVPLSAGRRGRGRGVPAFVAETAEGATAGQRGFSSRSDDDGDGALDEDPLDGRDNDGDGLVDEDFAAISDAMIVHERAARDGLGAPTRLEYYRWTYPHLHGAVFLKMGSPGGACRAVLDGVDWREMTVVAARHDLAGLPRNGRLAAHVARLSRDGGPAPVGCDPDQVLWLGVAFLDPADREFVIQDGPRLSLPLSDDPVPLVVCVAESRRQLGNMLSEAARVREGVTDRITGRRAAWIVPPLCAQCRLATAPDFTWRRDESGAVRVVAQVAAETAAGFDPDLFRLGGTWLGSPDAIVWRPESGPARRLPWGCRTLHSGGAVLDDPLADLAGPLIHGATGELEFVFARAPEDVDGNRLEGMFRDGRPFRVDARAEPTKAGPGSPSRPQPTLDLAPRAGVDQSRVLEQEGQGLRLAPHLLEGFPNPFRDRIQLRFQVPATMAEAFVWDPDEDPPAGLDLQATIPWSAGSPAVSVKIYSINGQELVTLYTGSMGPGEQTVSWSGTDAFGRQVSSGTYFCKLQLDDWSVTRRLIFVR